MRACVRVLGLLGPLGGCFVDPGNTSVGGHSAGESTGAGGSTSGPVTTAATTGDTGGVPMPTTSGTSTGEATGTTGSVSPSGSGTESTGESTGAATTGDASTGDASTGGVVLPVPGCEALFFTDFSEDPKDLLEVKGQWSWNEKAGTFTVQTQDGESSMANTLESWQDAVVYARVRVSSGYAVVRMRADVGLFNPSSYFGSMQPSADKVQIGRTLKGQTTVFQSPGFTSDFGVWYTLTLAVQGNDLSAGIDDQVLMQAKDGNLTKGQASIGGYGLGVAEFDWFLVCVAD